ncbi:putative transcriptional regulator of NADH dehydrogenase, Rrf2 family [Rhizobium sp. UR51a]|nr:putative transcriptional regulator of NADH dehydrogenase, Rrf2 family [Rhizobium sp. UR51a]
MWLMGSPDKPLSSRDLADLQGISPSFLAKIFPKLERAGLVVAWEGAKGGYRLAKQPENISVLEVVDAIEGRKPLFDCQEIRGRCAAFGGKPPRWATKGVCAVHAVMLHAEKAMRESLASQSLADIAGEFGRKAPAEFYGDVEKWIETRTISKSRGRSADE